MVLHGSYMLIYGNYYEDDSDLAIMYVHYVHYLDYDVFLNVEDITYVQGIISNNQDEEKEENI